MIYRLRLATRFLIGAALILGSVAVLPFAADANVGDGTCFGSGDKAAGECSAGGGGGGGGGGGPTVYIPQGSLSVAPTTINQGQSATLTWSCTEISGANSFVGYTSNFGAASPSGSMAVSPAQTTTYQFSCYSSASTDAKSAILTVNAAYPDVYAGATSPSSATAGTQVTFSSTVTNQGNAAASNFPNSFQISGIGYVAANVGSLAQGSSGAISGAYTFASAGTYQVRACADTNTSGTGAIVESDETNNCATSWSTIIVGAAPKPDLTPGQATITPAVGSLNALLQAVISNIGSAATNQ